MARLSRACWATSLTLWVGQEDEAPDAGDVAEDKAHGQHHPLSRTAAQPVDKQEACDHLHTTDAVNDAVLQLPEVKVLLGQRRHDGLRW